MEGIVWKNIHPQLAFANVLRGNLKKGDGHVPLAARLSCASDEIPKHHVLTCYIQLIMSIVLSVVLNTRIELVTKTSNVIIQTFFR